MNIVSGKCWQKFLKTYPGSLNEDDFWCGLFSYHASNPEVQLSRKKEAWSFKASRIILVSLLSQRVFLTHQSLLLYSTVAFQEWSHKRNLILLFKGGFGNMPQSLSPTYRSTNAWKRTFWDHLSWRVQCQGLPHYSLLFFLNTEWLQDVLSLHHHAIVGYPIFTSFQNVYSSAVNLSLFCMQLVEQAH